MEADVEVEPATEQADVEAEPTREQQIVTPQVEAPPVEADVEAEPATEQQVNTSQVEATLVNADVVAEPAHRQTCVTPQKFVSAAELSPLPHAEMQMRKSRAKSGDGAFVITSSPYLEKLHILETKKSTRSKRN